MRDIVRETLALTAIAAFSIGAPMLLMALVK